jgi:hypothetical protein
MINYKNKSKEENIKIVILVSELAMNNISFLSKLKQINYNKL